MIDQLQEHNSDLTRVIIIIAAIIFFIFSVGGNGLVILAYTVEKKVRTLSNSYLVSLALVDLTIGIGVMPFGFVYQYNQRWIFGPTFCQIWLMQVYGLGSISAAHLVLIAMDRYRILCQGIDYLQRRTIWNMLELVLFIWVIGVWAASPILADWNNVAIDPLTTKHCMLKKTRTWVLIINTIVFFIPGFLMVRLYSEVFIKIHRKLMEKVQTGNPPPHSSSPSLINLVRHKETKEFRIKLAIPEVQVDPSSDDLSGEEEQEQDVGQEATKKKKRISYKKERKSALTLGMLIGAFIIFWSPWAIITFIQAFSPETEIPTIFSTTGALLGWINSCVNPIVYAVRSKDFRNAFNKIFLHARRLCVNIII